MTVSAAITNLGKYNEGTLDFKWLELPATDAEWDAAFDAIGIGELDHAGIPYEEWFVSDYDDDSGCNIARALGEYPSIERCNIAGELAEEMEDADQYDLYNLVDENGLCWTEYGLDDVYPREDDVLDELARAELDSGGWERVFWFLRGMTDEPSSPYVEINAYGNMVPVHDYDEQLASARASIFSDVLDELSR